MDRELRLQTDFYDAFCYLCSPELTEKVLKRLKYYYRLDLTRSYRKIFTTDRGAYNRSIKQRQSSKSSKPIKPITPTMDQGRQVFKYYTVNMSKVPYVYLYFLRLDDQYNLALLIDNNQRMYRICLRVTEDCYRNELMIEGKIVKRTDGRHYFIMNDLVIGDKHVHTGDLTSSIEALNDFHRNRYQPDRTIDPFTLYVQDFISMNHVVSYLTDYVPDVLKLNRDDVSGLLERNSINDNVLILQLTTYPERQESSDEEVAKLDRGKELMMEVTAVDPERDLYRVYKDGKFRSRLQISNLDTSYYVRKLFTTGRATSDRSSQRTSSIEMRCTYSEEWGRWMPVIDEDAAEEQRLSHELIS